MAIKNNFVSNTFITRPYLQCVFSIFILILIFSVVESCLFNLGDSKAPLSLSHKNTHARNLLLVIIFAFQQGCLSKDLKVPEKYLRCFYTIHCYLEPLRLYSIHTTHSNILSSSARSQCILHTPIP